jgi:hypothetical protein
MHTVKPLVLEPSTFEDEIAFEKLKRYEKGMQSKIII